MLVETMTAGRRFTPVTPGNSTVTTSPGSVSYPVGRVTQGLHWRYLSP